MIVRPPAPLPTLAGAGGLAGDSQAGAPTHSVPVPRFITARSVPMSRHLNGEHTLSSLTTSQRPSAAPGRIQVSPGPACGPQSDPVATSRSTRPALNAGEHQARTEAQGGGRDLHSYPDQGVIAAAPLAVLLRGNA
jgi:hypothetical protein